MQSKVYGKCMRFFSGDTCENCLHTTQNVNIKELQQHQQKTSEYFRLFE